MVFEALTPIFIIFGGSLLVLLIGILMIILGRKNKKVWIPGLIISIIFGLLFLLLLYLFIIGPM